jgi:hypothetical protein
MAASVAGLSLGMVDISQADIWVKDPTTGLEYWCTPTMIPMRASSKKVLQPASVSMNTIVAMYTQAQTQTNWQ